MSLSPVRNLHGFGREEVQPLYICPKGKSCKRKHGCGHDFPHRVRTGCGDESLSNCPKCVELGNIVWVYQEEELDEF